MADTNDHDDTDYRYDEDAEGHENQLEFDRDFTTWDVLQKRGLIKPGMEEKIRENLERELPDNQKESEGRG